MHADLTGLEQSSQNPDPARVAQQPEHPGKALYVARWRQRRPEDIAPFLFAGQPTLPEVCGGAWNGPILRCHMNILSFDQMLASRPGPWPLVPFHLTSGETIAIHRGEMAPPWPTGGLTERGSQAACP